MITKPFNETSKIHYIFCMNPRLKGKTVRQYCLKSHNLMNFIMHICIHTQSIILRLEPYIRLTINFFSEKSKCGINVKKKKNMYATINHQVLDPETQSVLTYIFYYFGDIHDFMQVVEKVQVKMFCFQFKGWNQSYHQLF